MDEQKKPSRGLRGKVGAGTFNVTWASTSIHTRLPIKLQVHEHSFVFDPETALKLATRIMEMVTYARDQNIQKYDGSTTGDF